MLLGIHWSYVSARFVQRIVVVEANTQRFLVNIDNLSEVGTQLPPHSLHLLLNSHALVDRESGQLRIKRIELSPLETHPCLKGLVTSVVPLIQMKGAGIDISCVASTE
jgi:hypothetical protein